MMDAFPSSLFSSHVLVKSFEIPHSHSFTCLVAVPLGGDTKPLNVGLHSSAYTGGSRLIWPLIPIRVNSAKQLQGPCPVQFKLYSHPGTKQHDLLPRRARREASMSARRPCFHLWLHFAAVAQAEEEAANQERWACDIAVLSHVYGDPSSRSLG